MDYLDKYKGQHGRRSVYDILALDPNKDWETIKENYVATDIEKIVIGGNTFTNYGDFQFVWEKSYVKSPERSADGSIGNLNSYPTFVTPHLIINFSIMSIDDYRKIMRMDLEQNEFVVECYDPIYNKPFKGKMYFGTPQMAKLFKIAKVRLNGDEWEEFVELVGAQEYTVELIGTNNDLEKVSVSYSYNHISESLLKIEFEPSVYRGEEIVIGANCTFQKNPPSGMIFKHWVDASGMIYTDGAVITVNNKLDLYAIWDDPNQNPEGGVGMDKLVAPSIMYPFETGVARIECVTIVNGDFVYPDSYRIYANGVYEFSVPANQGFETDIDISTLLTEHGSFVFGIVATKSGFRDSNMATKNIV